MAIDSNKLWIYVYIFSKISRESALFLFIKYIHWSRYNELDSSLFCFHFPHLLFHLLFIVTCRSALFSSLSTIHIYVYMKYIFLSIYKGTTLYFTLRHCSWHHAEVNLSYRWVRPRGPACRRVRATHIFHLILCVFLYII